MLLVLTTVAKIVPFADIHFFMRSCFSPTAYRAYQHCMKDSVMVFPRVPVGIDFLPYHRGFGLRKTTSQQALIYSSVRGENLFFLAMEHVCLCGWQT